MNFLELKQMVSYWLDDLNMTYFTPTQLARWLNQAQREVQKLVVNSGNGYYLKCAQTTLIVNQRDYVQPDDFYKLNRLDVIVSGTPPNETCSYLNPISPNQQDLIAYRTGTPCCYFFKNNRLSLWPAPDTALTLRLLYSYKVADMVLDTDVPDVPEPFQEMIAVLAAYDGLLKDGRETAPLLAKLEMYKDMLKQDAAQRNVDESRTILYTGSYDDMGNFYF